MKRWLIISLIALVVSILHLQIFFSKLGERVEPWLLDVWFNLRGVDTPPEDLVVIAMDESSYRVLNLPLDQAWPRAVHAKILQRLADLGVKRIAMDILFLGASSDPKADQDLSEAFALTPTVIGTESVVKEVGAGGGSYSMEELLEPPEMFSKQVETIALAKMTEEFGYIRRFFVSRSVVTKDIPTLFEAAAGYKPRDPELPGPRDLIWYYGPPGTIETIPYHQVLNPEGRLPKDFLKNKTVFIGLNFLTEIGPAQKDTYRTAFDAVRTMFGVEILATAAANIMQKKWVGRASAATEGVVLFFLAMGLCVLIFSLKPQWAGASLLGLLILWLLISYIASRMGFFIPGVFLFFVFLPLSYLGSTLVFYLITYRSQQQVEKAFQFYVSPEMAHQMRDNPTALSLGGENVFATALFTDIAGFSQITETMNATEVSNMLNAYFTEVMNEIFEKKGTLIKFIGDAVFALWGAPIKSADHAKLATLTAIAISKAVERFNASKRFPALHTRIGVNTGPMLVGNLGSERRFDYTAIGDSVNLASRVEGINKYFGTSILITDATKKELGGSGEIETFDLGTIKVVGKQESVGLHAVVEKKPMQVLELEWQQGILAFRSRKWQEARSVFEALKSKDPFFNKPCELYIKEITYFETNPPEPEWQGEIEFTSK